MIRVALNLENPEDLQSAKAEWKFAPGLVPGEDNEGLIARLSGLPITTTQGGRSAKMFRWAGLADSPSAGFVSQSLCRNRCKVGILRGIEFFLRPA